VGFAQLTSNTRILARPAPRYPTTRSIARDLDVLRPSSEHLLRPGGGGYAPLTDVQRTSTGAQLSSSGRGSAGQWTGGVFFSIERRHPRRHRGSDAGLGVTTFSNGMFPFACPATRCSRAQTDSSSRTLETRWSTSQIRCPARPNIKLTETLKATLGLRYSRLHTPVGVRYRGLSWPHIQTESSARKKPITPKVVLSCSLTATSSCMRAPSEGLRPGVSMSAFAASAMAISSRSDLPSHRLHHERAPVAGPVLVRSPVSYEIGAKSTFLNHRLQLNSSLFLHRLKDIQQNVYLPSCGEPFTGNLGKVQSRGGDIEVSVPASRGVCGRDRRLY